MPTNKKRGQNSRISHVQKSPVLQWVASKTSNAERIYQRQETERLQKANPSDICPCTANITAATVKIHHECCLPELIRLGLKQPAKDYGSKLQPLQKPKEYVYFPLASKGIERFEKANIVELPPTQSHSHFWYGDFVRRFEGPYAKTPYSPISTATNASASGIFWHHPVANKSIKKRPAPLAKKTINNKILPLQKSQYLPSV